MLCPRVFELKGCDDNFLLKNYHVDDLHPYYV